MKLFKTNNTNHIYSKFSHFFYFKLSSSVITERSKSFFDKYGFVTNLCAKYSLFEQYSYEFLLHLAIAVGNHGLFSHIFLLFLTLPRLVNKV